jgi:NAD(P)H-nitrite reductase large subunit
MSIVHRPSSGLQATAMQLDDELCYCFHVSKRKVLNYIRRHKPRRASQISDCGGAGTGCGWCVPFLKRYFEQSQLAEPPVEEALTAEEYARGRQAHIASGKGKPPTQG